MGFRLQRPQNKLAIFELLTCSRRAAGGEGISLINVDSVEDKVPSDNVFISSVYYP